MKLHRALKAKKTLIGEIAKLKGQIVEKNSFLAGSAAAEKIKILEVYDELLKKVNDLVSLKYVINEANHPIQEQIYRLSELKALIAFWNGVTMTEGLVTVGYSRETAFEYKVHVDEKARDAIITEFQKKVDAIQEEIDNYNYTTDIPWGDATEDLPLEEGPDKVEGK